MPAGRPKAKVQPKPFTVRFHPRDVARLEVAALVAERPVTTYIRMLSLAQLKQIEESK
jgi:hypothetical protein